MNKVYMDCLKVKNVGEAEDKYVKLGGLNSADPDVKQEVKSKRYIGSTGTKHTKEIKYATMKLNFDRIQDDAGQNIILSKRLAQGDDSRIDLRYEYSDGLVFDGTVVVEVTKFGAGNSEDDVENEATVYFEEMPTENVFNVTESTKNVNSETV